MMHEEDIKRVTGFIAKSGDMKDFAGWLANFLSRIGFVVTRESGERLYLLDKVSGEEYTMTIRLRDKAVEKYIRGA